MRLTRRQALRRLAGGVLAAGGCGEASRRGVTTPEGIGGERLSFNVHALGGRFVTLQHQALAGLRPPWIRVTLGLVTGVDAARAYVGGGPSLLGLVADHRRGAIDAHAWPDLVEATLRRYPTARRAELLNEPEIFNELSPARYVREYLRPGFERVRERLPGVQVVAAAPAGDRKAGPDRFRRMTDAGADDVCDYRAVHVYFDDDRALRAFRGATGRPILVTETGTNAPGDHARWYRDVVPRIRAALGAEQIFWYVLLESAALAGAPVAYSYPGSSIIAAEPDAAGQPRAAPGVGALPAPGAARPAGRPLMRRGRVRRIGALVLLIAGAGPAAAEPRWWLATGGFAGLETGDLDDTLDTEGSGFLGGGVYLLRLGALRVGLEAEGSGGRVAADLGPAHDTVTVWRGRAGLRAAWWPAEDAPRLVPYLRAGGVYRADRGDLIEDDGFGWYAGLGLDVRLGAHWAVGPFVTYEAVSLSIETETVLVGVGVSFAW